MTAPQQVHARPAGPSRRQMFSLAGAGAGALALAGCVGPGTTRGGTGAVAGGAVKMPAPISGEPVSGELSFAHWRAEDKDAFATIIEGFVKENPKAGVRQDIAPSADYQATELQRIASGAVGDVFTAFRGSQFAAMASAGLFVPLGRQTFVDGYVAKLARPGRYQGVEVGLPYQLIYLMPMYNIDLFEKAGISEVPGDWDGFLSLCDALKGAGLIPIAWPAGDLGNGGQLFNSMVMNNGPTDDMCAKIADGTYTCTDDWFIKTLKQYQQLTPYFQDNAVGTQPQPCQQLFATQKAAMLATGSYDISSIRKLGATFPVSLVSPVTTTAEKARWTGTYNATFILGVSTRTKDRDAALAFVSYLSRPEVAQQYSNTTGQLSCVDGLTYDNPDLAAFQKVPLPGCALAPRYQFDNLDVEHAVEGACVKVVGGASPEQAAEEAQRVVEQNR